ncbi:MAG: hypothetical protein WCQ95_01085 [Bacteroidota bacterium]
MAATLKRACIFGIILWVFVMHAIGQTDTKGAMVKYSREFKFRDGIYATLGEWKRNSPEIVQFEALKEQGNRGIDNFVLKYTSPDSNGLMQTFYVKKCFAFVKNGVLYFSQGDYGYYRMFIVGALSHYMKYKRSTNPQYSSFNDPGSMLWSTEEYTEFLMDFKSGESFEFTFLNFREFLKQHDPELSVELEKAKNKRDMIHHYLLLYNEKHPIFFPAD